jgi:hypothetical protein
MRPPPPQATATSEVAKCDESRSLPAVDTVLGVILGVAPISVGAVGLAQTCRAGSDCAETNFAKTLGTIGVVIGAFSTALFGYSAYRGYSSAEKCEALGKPRGPAK